MPTGTVKKKKDIHIVYNFGGAHKSIHTGKYIINITWKNPTKTLVTKRMMKFFVKENTPTKRPFRIAEATIVFLG